MTDTFGPETKIGDEVCVLRFNRWNIGCVTMHAGVIERLTESHVIALNGRRWLRRNGVEYGAGGSKHDRDQLTHLTADVRAQVAHSDVIHRAVLTCRRVAALLEKARGDEAVRLAALLPDEMREPKETGK